MATQTCLGAPIYHTTLNKKTGVTTVDKSFPGYGSKLVVSRSDTIKRPLPQGANKLFSPTGIYRSRRYYSDCVYVSDGKDVTVSYASFNAVAPATLSHSLTYEESQAVLNQLRSALKGQHVNLAQALAEYKQTASLFADSAKSVVGLWRALRLRRLPDALRYKGLGVPIPGHYQNTKWADKWLKFQYGAMPLLADVQGSLRALEVSRPALVRVAAHRDIFKSVTEMCPAQGAVIYTTVPRVTTYRARVSWEAYGEVVNPVVNAFTSLGFTNPVHLAYELLPGSFVLDWFINLGDVLANLDALTGYSRVSCTQSWKTEHHCTNGLGGILEGEDYSRNPVSLSSSAWPAWQPSLSWRRIVSGTALLQQVARSRR